MDYSIEVLEKNNKRSNLLETFPMSLFKLLCFFCVASNIIPTGLQFINNFNPMFFYFYFSFL
jgi:hypothetical protein